MKSGIYQILNTVNGNRYVGSAADFRVRWNDHLYRMRAQKHHSCVMQRAFNRYGEEAFVFQKLLFCDRSNLEMYEQRFLDGLQPEYNILKFANSPKARFVSAETREKMAAAKRGRKASPETRAKMSAKLMGNKRSLGRKVTLSEDHKAALIAGRKAWKVTPEAVLKSKTTKFERGLIRVDPRQ